VCESLEAWPDRLRILSAPSWTLGRLPTRLTTTDRARHLLCARDSQPASTVARQLAWSARVLQDSDRAVHRVRTPAGGPRVRVCADASLNNVRAALNASARSLCRPVFWRSGALRAESHHFSSVTEPISSRVPLPPSDSDLLLPCDPNIRLVVYDVNRNYRTCKKRDN